MDEDEIFELDEEVTCERKYYRCVISCGMISYGWINFLIIINTIATTFLGAFAASNNLSQSGHDNIALGQIITGVAAISLMIIKRYIIKHVKSKEKIIKLKCEPKLYTRAREASIEILSCERKYYRFIVVCGKIVYGWINLLIMFNTIATTFLGAFNNYSDTSKNTIALGQIITGATAVSLIILKQYIINNVKFQEKILQLKEPFV